MYTVRFNTNTGIENFACARSSALFYIINAFEEQEIEFKVYDTSYLKPDDLGYDDFEYWLDEDETFSH
jgi:hypothetical protein